MNINFFIFWSNSTKDSNSILRRVGVKWQTRQVADALITRVDHAPVMNEQWNMKLYMLAKVLLNILLLLRTTHRAETNSNPPSTTHPKIDPNTITIFNYLRMTQNERCST